MLEKNYIGVIGGDKRQYYMSQLLKEKGLSVVCLDVVKKMEEEQSMIFASSLEEIMKRCQLIICPIPFSRDGHYITSNSDTKLEIDDFISLIQKHHIIIGGNLPQKVIDKVVSENGIFFDFMKDEDITVKNAIATAEGTIAEAIQLSDRNLYQSKCLILGYGRCAKALAVRIKQLGAEVTIAARSLEQREQAKQDGMNVNSLEEWKEIGKYHFIFNTIPAMVLTSAHIDRCREDAVIIDIASKPGGTDFEACNIRGIKSVLALGLPGKYSPYTSAEILVDSISHLLPQNKN